MVVELSADAGEVCRVAQAVSEAGEEDALRAVREATDGAESGVVAGRVAGLVAGRVARRGRRDGDEDRQGRRERAFKRRHAGDRDGRCNIVRIR